MERHHQVDVRVADLVRGLDRGRQAGQGRLGASMRTMVRSRRRGRRVRAMTRRPATASRSSDGEFGLAAGGEGQGQRRSTREREDRPTCGCGWIASRLLSMGATIITPISDQLPEAIRHRSVPVRQAPSLVQAPPVRSQVRPETYGPAVHDRQRDHPAVRGVLEGHLRAARQRPVGDPDEGRRQGQTAGGPVAVEPGAVPGDVPVRCATDAWRWTRRRPWVGQPEHEPGVARFA